MKSTSLRLLYPALHRNFFRLGTGCCRGYHFRFKMAADPDSCWPREQETREYLEKHKILELLNNLTSTLIYERPEEPKKHMIETIERLLKAQKSSNKPSCPCLFDDSNIQSVYGMLDQTNKGFISIEQYKEALLTLGIKDFNEEPTGCEIGEIAFDTFLKEARDGLQQSSATYST